MVNHEDNRKEEIWIDPIEERQIDKFVCDEVGRQIHRYIKGMSGSKTTMLLFEERLKSLTVKEKEHAIALYIDLNRKAIRSLDWKIVLTRAMANYCDTFAYFLEIANDKRRMVYYLNRMKEKYIRFHEVFEENGKYGMKDADGNIILKPLYDFLRTPYVYVDDLTTLPVIAQKDGKMGLVVPNEENTVVADFVYDNISLRDEPPFFEAQKGEETILL